MQKEEIVEFLKERPYIPVFVLWILILPFALLGLRSPSSKANRQAPQEERIEEMRETEVRTAIPAVFTAENE